MNRNTEKLLAVILIGIAVGAIVGPWQGVGTAGALWLLDNWLSHPTKAE